MKQPRREGSRWGCFIGLLAMLSEPLGAMDDTVGFRRTMVEMTRELD